MQLALTYPMMITPRLMAGCRVADAFISVDPCGTVSRDGKPYWTWYVDLANGAEFTGSDLAGWGDHREMLGALLSFLSACGEGRSYARRTGRESENANLFPEALAEWCDTNSEELAIMCCEIEETRDCCVAS